MGAKVLHPRCLPPVREHRIPMHIRCTERPEAEGTVISAAAPSHGPQVKSVSSRSGITLISMDTLGMWQQVGFLADVFAVFKRHGLSIDLVSTSESNVTVSLDPAANALDGEGLSRLIHDLSAYCQARAIERTAAVSLVGRSIRGLLHRLGPALQAFEEQRIHLVSQAASDLNLTVVVDEDQADRLVRSLHALLFADAAADPLFGPPMATEAPGPTAVTPWWRRRRDDLLALADRTPLYVYDEATIDAAVAAVRGIGSVDRVLYAVKANPYPPLLRRFHASGLGFECVSPGEIALVTATFPDIDRRRVLFTPNFAPRAEYEAAFVEGVHVTLDNLWPLERWPDVFAGRDVFVRLDPGRGRGHHHHVRTAGEASKFGIGADDIDRLRILAERAGCRIVGLHAHTGSGIRDVANWRETALFLAEVADRFPHVAVLDVGGGLGVPEKPGQPPLDLAALDRVIGEVRRAHPRFAIWLEPGRFLVAQAGVLLTRVTQLKRKGEVAWVGVDTGMNSLIRPALYGAWHEIANLTRADAEPDTTTNVVGPICESGDVLGHQRLLPAADEGDVLVIATAGAYGRAMSSRYNLREPAAEHLLPKSS